MSTPTTLVKIIEQSGLDKSKSDYLLEKFADYTAIAAEWEKKAKEIVVTDESQTDLMKQASEGRKLLKNKRVDIEKTRKELKAASLAEGRAIDEIAKSLTALIEPTEDYLQLQEDFAKIKEQQRISVLDEERRLMIEPYIDTFVSPFSRGQLGAMPEQQFDAMLLGYKSRFETLEQARINAENERIAKEEQDKKDREAQRIENERLKKEADERERADKERRDLQGLRLHKLLPYNPYGADVDMNTLWELSEEKFQEVFKEKFNAFQRVQKDKKEQEEKEKEEKRIADELKLKLVKQLNEERKERERKEKEDADEFQRLKDEQEKLESAPDKEKLKMLAEIFGKYELPEMKSKKAKMVMTEINIRLAALSDFILKSSSRL